MVGVSISQALTTAFEHQHAGRGAQAAEIFGEILKIQPDSAQALYHLGMYEWGQGAQDTGADRLVRALELEPDRVEVLINLAVFRWNQGRIQEACALLLRARMLRPDLSGLPPFTTSADILLNQGRMQAASAPEQSHFLFDLAMRIAPVHARAQMLSLFNANDPYALAVAQAKAPADIEELARFYVPQFSYKLDIGTGCNLRCAYCIEVSNEEEKASRHKRIVPISDEAIEAEIQFIQKIGVTYVNLGGWGEVTVKPNWTKMANKLADLNIPISMISNFAKRFSDEEIKTLARFRSIVISCDTVNPEIAKRVRNPLNIEVMFDNIRALKAMAPHGPGLLWNATVSNLMIFELPQWVATGADLGIGQFNINSIIMTPYAQEKAAAIGLCHVSELSEDERRRAQQSLEEAEALAAARGCRVWVDEGIRGALAGFQEDRDEKGKVSYRPLAQGMTRACLYPWNALGLGLGKVSICCQIDELQIEPNSTEALDRALTSDALLAIRRGLLEGRPVEECVKCRLVSATTPASLLGVIRNLHGLFGSQSGIGIR